MINLSKISSDHSFYLAVDYFLERECYVDVFSGNHVSKFHDVRKSGKDTPSNRYTFAIWALMAFRPNDKIVFGIIDPYGDRTKKDVHSAWVEFTMPGKYENADECFVYDPLCDKLVPRDVWVEACKPRDTSCFTQYEIVAKYFDPKYALILRPWNACVFFHADKMPNDEKNDENIERITAALCEGYLTGMLKPSRSEGLRVDYFIARD
jgi:hypothetical protein